MNYLVSPKDYLVVISICFVEQQLWLDFIRLWAVALVAIYCYGLLVRNSLVSSLPTIFAFPNAFEVVRACKQILTDFLVNFATFVRRPVWSSGETRSYSKKCDLSSCYFHSNYRCFWTLYDLILQYLKALSSDLRVPGEKIICMPLATKMRFNLQPKLPDLLYTESSHPRRL